MEITRNLQSTLILFYSLGRVPLFDDDLSTPLEFLEKGVAVAPDPGALDSN